MVPEQMEEISEQKWIKIESKEELLPVEDPFLPNQEKLAFFEDDLVLSYLSKKCVICDQDFELRKMDEHLRRG